MTCLGSRIALREMTMHGWVHVFATNLVGKFKDQTMGDLLISSVNHVH